RYHSERRLTWALRLGGEHGTYVHVNSHLLDEISRELDDVAGGEGETLTVAADIGDLHLDDQDVPDFPGFLDVVLDGSDSLIEGVDRIGIDDAFTTLHDRFVAKLVQRVFGETLGEALHVHRLSSLEHTLNQGHQFPRRSFGHRLLPVSRKARRQSFHRNDAAATCSFGAVLQVVLVPCLGEQILGLEPDLIEFQLFSTGPLAVNQRPTLELSEVEVRIPGDEPIRVIPELVG